MGLPYDDDEDDDDNDDAPLPFPSALPRSDFLVPDFDPAAYLSSLPNRHQTLEDLRSELRDRSNAISAELLELVNSNYTTFLSLGNDLKGGDEKVEDVKVSLLTFRRQVEEIRDRVQGREGEVGDLNRELREVRGAIETGRQMLDLAERLDCLEDRLALGVLDAQAARNGGVADDWADEYDYDSEAERSDYGGGSSPSGFVGTDPSKLASLAKNYCRVNHLADRIGRSLPFVSMIEERITRCRNTILLDLNTATKEARKSGSRGSSRLFGYLSIYRDLDGQAEAVKALSAS